MDLLKEGIDILCKDEDINNLIAPRKDEVISLLEQYIKEIETFNDAYGLVKVSGKDELIIKHILDSLAPLGIIFRLLKDACSPLPARCSLKIADAGSGAGLPGIPLAIALPNKALFRCDFSLIERKRRRAGFLFSTASLLGLQNTAIVEKDLEQTESGRFDLVTFRAFSPLEPKILKTLFRVCKKTGIIASYKGKREKIDQEIAAVKNYCSRHETIPYKVPFLDEQRHLVVLKPNDC